MLRQLPQVLRQARRHGLQRRLVTNNSLNSSQQNSTTSPPLPPQQINNPSRSKLELRPGPIKTPTISQSPTSNSPSPTSNSNSPTTKLPSKSALETSSSTSTTSSLSDITQSTKHDLDHAQQHGVLAPPPLDASWARRMLHQAIELFKFYYRGIKLINTHRVQVAAIKQRIKSGGSPLTRKEARFIDTFHHDLKKLVPFLITVLILEEIIPLIALYAPSMLPSTCILPSQRIRIHEKKHDKAVDFARTYRPVLASAVAGPILDKQHGPMALCAVLRISTIGPDIMRRRRVSKHLEQVKNDDQMLAMEDMGAKLADSEVVEALEERGITFGGLPASDARNRLTWWLKAVSKPSTDTSTIRQSLIAQRLPSFK